MDIDTINRAEYHSNILDDDRNVLILAWIEKSGLTTEKEICKEIGFNLQIVKNIILKLFNNQLIELSGQLIKTSAKGKLVIDTLKLSEDIVKYFYPLGLGNHDRKIWDSHINYYRSNYYADYQKSCLSVKAWDYILETKEVPNIGEENRRDYYLVIMLYDSLGAMREEDENELGNDIVRTFLFGHQVHKEMAHLSSHSLKVLNLLGELNSVQIKTDFNKFDDFKKEFYTFLSCKDLYLSDTSRHYWTLQTDSKKLDEKYNIYHKWKFDWLKEVIFDFKLEKAYRYQIPPEGLENNLLETMTFLLENCQTLENLAKSQNKSIEETRILVNRIYHNIGRLT